MVNIDRMKRVNELADLLWDEPEARWEAILRDRVAGEEDLMNEVISFARQCRDKNPSSLRPVVFVDADAVLKDPEVIGRYEVVRRIGKGGMGVVYEALRPGEEIERRVAIKVIKPGFDSEEVVRRFRKERYILSQLGNLRIVQIFDSGSMPDGRPYLVMEYVDGGVPIDEYCAARNLGVTERLKLFQKVCTAVEYAHQRLVVHRDLKPSNILVTPDGEPKLLDFGLAGLLETRESDPSFVHSVAALVNTGTWEYMSPEQARGEPALTVSDIYSLGVVLFELLAGRRPYDFPSESPAVVTKIICKQEAPRVSSIALEGSALRSAEEKLSALQRRDLDEIVDVAIAKLPDDRYATISAFSETVQTYLEGKPIPSLRSDWRYRTKKFVRRNRRVLAVTAMVTLSLCAGGGYFWKHTQQQAIEKAFKEKLAASARQDGREVLSGALREIHKSVTGEDLDAKTAQKALQERAQRGDTAAKLTLGIGMLGMAQAVKKLPQSELPTSESFNKGLREKVHESDAEETGLNLMLQSAETNPTVAALVAGMYLSGSGGFKQDSWEGFKWAKKAAEAGNSLGAGLLGHLYYHGQGTPKDKHEGIRWTTVAADSGQLLSQAFLCGCYGEGFCEEKDIIRGHMYCNLASSNKQWTGIDKGEIEAVRAKTAKERDDLEKRMTPEQIRKAEAMAAELSEKILSRQ